MEYGALDTHQLTGDLASISVNTCSSRMFLLLMVVAVAMILGTPPFPTQDYREVR
jgi:hypothetical protein